VKCLGSTLHWLIYTGKKSNIEIDSCHWYLLRSMQTIKLVTWTSFT